MALDPLLCAGVAFCRGYHGLDYDDSLLVVKKALELVEATDDEADFFEKIDLVWGAALADGLINPGDWTVPVDPRPKDIRRAAMNAMDHWMVKHGNRRPCPVEYDDPAFKPKKSRKKRKKRRTLPDV